MTTVQKVIKYLALALAIFIIVNIVSAILSGIYIMSNISGAKNSEKYELHDMKEIETNIETSSISKLEIDIDYSNLTIKKGDKLKVESNSSAISCNQNNNKIIIKERNHNWFSKIKASDLVIYIPTNIMFEQIDIATGAGEINIEELNAEKLDFEIGAGKVEIQKLNILEKAIIDGGAGKVEILSGTINDLDLDMGVGAFELKAKLTGKNDIDAGVGKLDIDLTDEIDNYTIKVSKGIGSVNINGKEVSNDSKNGNGDTYIEIDGGVGSINIKTKEMR